MKGKIRIDKLLRERKLAVTRERAQAYIMAGRVLVNEQKISKPGAKIDINASVRVKGIDQPYVSRGGLKLEKIFPEFDINPKNKIVMDIGASTGGFTDCLLSRGAAYVFAVDVGYNQLAWKLVKDKKVKNLEKTNFRHLEMPRIGTFVDLIVIDVSFISLTKILSNCAKFMVQDGDLAALIKPQFEAGRDKVGKGGVVKEPETQKSVVRSIKQHAAELGFIPQKTCLSPIKGKKKGNQEFLLHLKKPF